MFKELNTLNPVSNSTIIETKGRGAGLFPQFVARPSLDDMFEDLVTEDLVLIWQKTTLVSLKRNIESEILVRNIGLTHYALKTAKTTPEDFKQQLYFNLVECLDRYDGRGKFSTYFVWFLRKCKTYFENNHKIIHTPIKRRTKHGYNERLMGKKDSTISLETPIGEGKETIASMIPTDIGNPEQNAINQNHKEIIEELLKSLPPKHRDLMEKHYGYQGKIHTLCEISRVQNITHERLRQIRNDILIRFKKRLSTKRIYAETKGKLK